MQLGGRYFDLYTRQHGIEQNLFLAPGEGDVPEEVGTNASVARRERCGSDRSGDGVGDLGSRCLTEGDRLLVFLN